MSEEDASSAGKPRRWSAEVVGEIILLAIVGGFFAYLFVSSLSWPKGAALMPRIIVIIGVPFLILRVIALLRPPKPVKDGEIMDMGFRIGDDPVVERKRFMRICLFIVGLYFAIWVFGFHVALPLGMTYYLRAFGKVSWKTSLVVGASFLAVIIGIYDHVLHANWHEPLILQLWGAPPT